MDIFINFDFPSLTATSSLLRQEAPTIRLGAQDSLWEDNGAYTPGEVSPAVLKSIGCTLAKLGHAARRKLFKDNDADVAKKAEAAIRNGMTPLVCRGEKPKGTTAEAVEDCRPQIQSILRVTNEEVIFAYEPVCAIGQFEPTSAEYVVAVTKELRKLCGKRAVRFLYGGSAGPGTFDSMREGVDGLFLGRFAHNPASFHKVITEVGS